MRAAANDNSCMKLGGQGRGAADHRGFAMAALLVGMSIMAILMGAALPVWNRQAQREREEEYLFRANEYARAVMKFRMRIANATPPNFDVLVEQRYLRRKYKDPITGEDFQPVYQTVAAPGQPGGAAQPGQMTGGFGSGTAGTGAAGGPGSTGTPTGGGFGSSGQTSTTATGGTPTSGSGAPVPGAGVIGVVSKSKATSIKIYNGRTRYDQWAVTYMDVKPGKGLPPDLLQAVNAAGRASANGQQGGLGQSGAGNSGAGAFPGATGQRGAQPFGQPGAQPFGAPGQQPFGMPQQQPLGQPGQAPFGQPGQSPFGQPGAQPPGGSSIFQPAYPPPPTPGGFGQPPRKIG